MDAADWRDLLQGIRPEDQGSLYLWLSGGTEISVQRIAKVEDELMLVRGRAGGQAEGGRIIIVPFDKIDAIFVDRIVDAEETDLFSPSVSLEQKEEIAKRVAEKREKARQEAAGAEATFKQEGVAPDIKDQLEALRESAGFAGKDAASAPPATQPPVAQPATPQSPATQPALPAPGQTSAPGALPPKRGLPPKLLRPKRPRPPGSEGG